MVLKYGKNGYEDCMENESLTISLENKAVRKIKEDIKEKGNEKSR